MVKYDSKDKSSRFLDSAPMNNGTALEKSKASMNVMKEYYTIFMDNLIKEGLIRVFR